MHKLYTFLFLFFLGAAHAQIHFDHVVYRGTGCPQGSVSTAVSPDGLTLSILFDEFRAEVPQYDGNNDNHSLPSRGGRNINSPALSHKNCALSFTATLPPNTMAQGLEVSLNTRGAVMFDQGIEGVFASILVGYNGMARSQGRPTIIAQKHWRSLRGPLDEEFFASPRTVVNLNSSCAGPQGGQIRFDLKNHVKAEIPSGDTRKSGIITVDSADMLGMLRLTVRTRGCAGGRVSPVRR